MAFDPRQLSAPERDRCLEVLGAVRGELDVLPLIELGSGPQELACDFMRRRAAEIVDRHINQIIQSMQA